MRRPNHGLVQPGAEANVSIKLGETPEASNESILDSIFSQLLVTKETNGQTMGTVLVSEHQLFVGLLISA